MCFASAQHGPRGHHQHQCPNGIAIVLKSSQFLNRCTRLTNCPIECANSAKCAPYKHHYDECVERVTRQEEDEDYKGPKEDCVEECKSPPALGTYLVSETGVVADEVFLESPDPNMILQFSTSSTALPPALPPSSGRSSSKRIAYFLRCAAFRVLASTRPLNSSSAVSI